MSDPVSSQDPNDIGSKEVVNKPDEADPVVQDFHAKNQQRKRELIRSLRDGVAFGAGKEMAEQFIEWLIDNC